MTREKAIQMLKAIIDEGWLISDFDKCPAIDACEMAIEALEQEPRWIPIITRKPTEEEKKDYFGQNGEELCYMIDSPMPLNGQEVLVSIGEFVVEDVFDEDFYNFENNDIEDVDAWMPKPKSYEVDMREVE